MAKDMVFQTETQDHFAKNAVWVVTEYDPVDYKVEYLRYEPDVKIGRISVNCFSLNNSETTIRVTYIYTALSEAGNEFIDNFTGAEYDRFIESWYEAIRHYLKTGQLLKTKP